MRSFSFPKLKIKNRYSLPAVQSVDTGIFMAYKPDQQVAANFIEAVKVNPDDAWVFVSKVYSSGLDLNEIRDVLMVSPQSLKWITKATYINDPKNCMTRSVYVEDPVRNLRRLLHLRMIKEPDQNGLWKICGVEQEECVRI